MQIIEVFKLIELRWLHMYAESV